MPDALARAVEPGQSDTTANPFRVLVRHFFGQFFDNESLSPQADATANLGPLLAVLAMPGAFMGILLLPLTLTGWGLVTFRSFFVSFSMILMAFIMVFRWDALFPDRRDYHILTPLPLRPSAVFLAKTSAIGLFLGLFLVDLNITGTLIWPAIDQGPNSLQCLAAHAIAVIAAGLFAALATGALQGLLVNLLPARAYRRASVWLQTFLMTVLVMGFFLIPLAAHALRGLVRTEHPVLRWLPNFWFVGLYEQLRPVTHDPALYALGDLGWRALGFAAVAFVVTWIPGYRIHAPKFADVPSADPRGPGRMRTAWNHLVNRWVLTTPVERAVFHFITQTVTRSMKHRVFLAVYLGFGAALGALSFASGQSGMKHLPLTLSFILVSGLRAAFSVPSELRANWAFQVTETGCAREVRAAIRKWIVLCGIAPLFLLLAALTPDFYLLVFGFALSVLLVEILFYGFRKVAFTCAYFPGRSNLIGLGVVYAFGFTAYSRTMLALEQVLVSRPAAAVLFLAAIACACILPSRWDQASNEPLDYEGDGDPIVRTLGVASR